MKTQLLTAVTMGVLLSATSHAAVSGKSSNETYIRVGGTQGGAAGHPGASGLPGIGVDASKTKYKAIALSGLKFYSNIAFQTRNNVAYIRPNMMPPTHRDFGSYAFSDTTNSGANLGLTGDVVYFGEWSRTGNMTDNTHTVYYVGRNKTANMPSSGTATYSVKGINNVQNNGLMQGTLTANFNTNKIGGSLSNSSLTVGINNNTINPNNASFSGSATANGVNGTSKGEFFGNNAAKLGGIATFANKSLNTAFAGNKN